MDFSAFNPTSSNSLSLAARNNDVPALKRLLRKMNPNCVDNRGWTCLHEAASSDNYECLRLILKHRKCRPLAETFEGHTALYLACRNECSLKCIQFLLDNVEDISQYASTEMVSPLHLACMQGNVGLVQLLLDYNSIINLKDFDGDTPLHEAVRKQNAEVVAVLLHAGAEPEIRNEQGFTPLHIACLEGSFDSVSHLYPFITDINDNNNIRMSSPLMLASIRGHVKIVEFLLSEKADVNKKDSEGSTALDYALRHGEPEIFRILLNIMDHSQISRTIFLEACKLHNFNIDIVVTLLESDLDPEFFTECDSFFAQMEPILKPVYTASPTLNSFLRVAEYIYKLSPDLFRRLLYLLLMRGVAVNALDVEECPPLVYIHYWDYSNCIEEVMRILIEHGCDIDYTASPGAGVIPDIIQTALMTQSSTLIPLLQHSIKVEPESIIGFMKRNISVHCVPYICMKGRLSKLAKEKRGLSHLSSCLVSLPSLPTLEHICRLRVRRALRDNGIATTSQFLKAINTLHLPETTILFLRYLV